MCLSFGAGWCCKVFEACGEPPEFDYESNGGPSMWQKCLSWKKLSKSSQRTLQNKAVVDIDCILRFLALRVTAEDKPVSDLLFPPEEMEDGWFRFALKSYDSSVELFDYWQRGWHGTKMEAVYCILFHNYIAESRNSSRGECMLANTPGVYLHKDASAGSQLNFLIRSLQFVDIMGHLAYKAIILLRR